MVLFGGKPPAPVLEPRDPKSESGAATVAWIAVALESNNHSGAAIPLLDTVPVSVHCTPVAPRSSSRAPAPSRRLPT